MSKAKFYYRVHGRFFEICQNTTVNGCTVFGERVQGEKTYTNREEARKRVCELNNWKYSPRTY